MTLSEPFSPAYRVSVYDNFKHQSNAYVELAEKNDILSLNSFEWTCDWKRIWDVTDFDCEGIIKIVYKDEILGLARSALYPYPCKGKYPNYLEIRNLECISRLKRSVNPVGFWLIWYSVKIAFDFCEVDPELGYLITLDSLEGSIPYYQDKVKMQGIGWTTTAPGEDCYVFIFTKEDARAFLSRIEGKYGRPVLIR